MIDYNLFLIDTIIETINITKCIAYTISLLCKLTSIVLKLDELNCLLVFSH